MYTSVPISVLEKVTLRVFGVCARVSAFVLLLVLLLLPLAPVFADETVFDTHELAVEVIVPEELSSVQDSILQQNSDVSEIGGDMSYDVAVPLTSEVLQTPEDATVQDFVVGETAVLSDFVTSGDVTALQVSEEEVGEENILLAAGESVVTDGSDSEEGRNEVTQSTDDYANTATESDVLDEFVTTSDGVTKEAFLVNEEVVVEEIIGDKEVAEVIQDDTVETPAEATSTTATSSESEVIGEDAETVVLGANHILHNEDDFLFAKNACVSVGDGSFYCTEATSSPVTIGVDRVFAAVDAEGDREIYIEKDGQLAAVTQNLADDDAPFYDAVSESIVWHRLVDGRYQIVSYDLIEEEERVLTHDHYNNMEPSRYDTLTVWQGWVGDDWEIMLEENSSVRMLTDNTYHDIAPRINGGYIIWQSFEENAWRVKVYDIYTGRTETIDDTDGMSLENPRFVLVYDAKQKNGDVETKGYDLQSKKIVPLSTTPAPTPDSLPDPEQTGEERALVQTPIQVKTKSETEQDGEVPVEPQLDTLDNETGTEHIADVIIDTSDVVDVTEMQSDSVLYEDTYETIAATTSTASIEDLTIPLFVAESTGGALLIEDLIVTPYVEAIEVSGDSQAEVATST